MRLVLALAAALAATACSGEERATEPAARSTSATTSAQTTTAAPAPVALSLEELVVTERTKEADMPYASLAELRWAGGWIEWRERTEDAVDRLKLALGTSGLVSDLPAGAIRRLTRCTRDVAAIGVVPTTRLVPVVRATGEACSRYEIAAAALVEAERGDAAPPELAFAQKHFDDAGEEVRRVVRGLSLVVGEHPFVDAPSRKSRIQIRYTHAASKLMRRQVTIRCFGPVEWSREIRARRSPPGGRLAGFVQAHGVSGNLAPVVCGWLDRLAYRRKPPTDPLERAQVAQAVGVLGHEAQHAVGTRNEAVTECYGMQRIRALARALGASREDADALAGLYWTDIYPRNLPRYRSPECRPGGPLDLSPKTPAWP